VLLRHKHYIATKSQDDRFFIPIGETSILYFMKLNAGTKVFCQWPLYPSCWQRAV